MPYRANYPATVAEILDESMTFRRAALRAVRAFARSRPWRGSNQERQGKFRQLNAALAAAYGIQAPALRFPDEQYGDRPSGSSNYRPHSHSITIHGRMSVVTFLHEFAHARGFDERQAVRWSVNLFRRCFPRSYARCEHVGHVLVATNRR